MSLKEAQQVEREEKEPVHNTKKLDLCACKLL